MKMTRSPLSLVGRAGPNRLQPGSSVSGSTRNAVSSRGRMARNPGPIKAPQRRAHPISNTLTNADSDISSSNDRLRHLVGRVASRPRVASTPANPRMMMRKKGGKVKKYADGGKVSFGLAGIRALARQLKEALDRGDEETMGRIARRMEKLEPGSSKAILKDPSEKARGDKLATFAKGGKVKAPAKASRAVFKSLKRRLNELESKLAYGKLDKNGRVEGETPEQAKAREEYDALFDEIEKKFGVWLIDDQ